MDGGRRTGRSRKVSQHFEVFDEADRRKATTARLDALEKDDHVEETHAEASDDEFMLEESDEELVLGDSKRKKKKQGKPGKRKTRAGVSGQAPKNFAGYLEEANLERLPEGVHSYLTAAAGPPRGSASRKWCSVCGFAAPYKCVRCGSRFCNRKCYAVHTDTRCLKFIS